jgi:hypothetical protein
MKIFNKDNLDILSTSPGNYIFKNKANKSEFGKFSSIIHILASLAILIFYLISYFKGKEMTIIYSKKNKLPEKENDEYKCYNESNKRYTIIIRAENGDNIQDLFDGLVDGTVFNITKYYLKDENEFVIGFTSSSNFYINIFKTQKFYNNNFLSNYLMVYFFYTTSNINEQSKIVLKENDFPKVEFFYIDLKKSHLYCLKKNYIIYRDGIRRKTFLSYLFFWTHYETTYVDFYYNNYYYYSRDDNSTEEVLTITNENINKEVASSLGLKTNDDVDYYQRKYESFFNTLSKWCGMFCTLKILFSSLVNEFSFSYNNYKLIKYIDKKNEMNKTIILSNDNNNNSINNNNNNSINKMKNIDLNKIDNKTKYFNKIKTKDIIKYTFFGCCCKSKTHKFINDCNNYVTQHISIEEIFYNMLCLENIIEEYKFKDNNHLKKYEEMKNKIESYENEMTLIDKNKDNINQNLNSNLIDKSSNIISMKNMGGIND